MARLTEKQEREMEKEAEEDFGQIIPRKLVSKWTASKVLDRHEKTIRGYIADGQLVGHQEKDGYQVETVSIVAFLFKKMHTHSREFRRQEVRERFSKHGLIRK